jgi:hypothetical protein
VTLSPVSSDTLEVSIAWQALRGDLDDYKPAVLIVTQNPPITAEQIVSYVVQEHLVDGTYPASRMVAGEVAWDRFRLTTSPDARWLSIRNLEAADGSLRLHDRDRFALPLPAVTPVGND